MAGVGSSMAAADRWVVRDGGALGARGLLASDRLTGAGRCGGERLDLVGHEPRLGVLIGEI